MNSYTCVNWDVRWVFCQWELSKTVAYSAQCIHIGLGASSSATCVAVAAATQHDSTTQRRDIHIPDFSHASVFKLEKLPFFTNCAFYSIRGRD